MNLAQIKLDRANGVVYSSREWDAVLEYAIGARDAALEEAAALWDSESGAESHIAKGIRALRSNSAATGKPDGEP